MNNSTWLWFPRIATIIYITFLSLFSLDAFATDLPFSEQLTGFLLHSIPSIILIAVLIFTFRNPMRAGIGFIAIGLIMLAYFKHYQNWDIFLVIEFPLILIGSTFLIYHLLIRDKLEDTNSTK